MTQPKTTAPPEWCGRPGTIRGLPILYAASAYASAVQLGLALPPELTEAVARASRANRFVLDVEAEVRRAEAEYASQVRSHIDDPTAPMPDLGPLALAVAAAGAADRASAVIGHAADHAEQDAVRALAASSGALIEQARPVFERLLDDLAAPAAVIPPTVKDLAGAARAGRSVLAAWQLVEDALPRYSALRELRGKLHHLVWTGPNAQQIVLDGLLAYRDPVAANRLFGGSHDPACILAGTVRGRAACGPWLPTAEELGAALAEQKEARLKANAGRPAQRVGALA